MTERERALLQGKKINPLTANESALAYAVAHGSSEPTYETVAEIPVGTMEKPEGAPYYVFVSDEAFPVLDEETYYFNSSNNPSDSVLSYEGQVMWILWNAKMEEADIVPIDQNKPWYGFTNVDNKVDNKSGIISDTPDLSNTTVRILKKVEQGGGGDSGDFLITATLDESKTPEEGTLGFFTLDKTAAEIEAAYTANRPMRVKMAHMENGKSDIIYFGLCQAGFDEESTVTDLVFIGTTAGEPTKIYTIPCYISYGEVEGELAVECVIYAPVTGS